MNKDEMMLRDAGFREHDAAQKIAKELPRGLSFKDLLDHGVYDARADEIVFTFGSVARRWKVGDQ